MLSVARALEEGRPGGVIGRCLSRAWGAVAGRALVRPLDVPAGTCVVAVGGATLGGSGKTPLAIACARELARRGVRVALVGHAYRADPGHARVVSSHDPLHEVGDEALLGARMLEPHGVRVVVAPSRTLAVEHAAREADVLVLDGALQIAPVPAALSLLAVDADEPWGHARAMPPLGDLRAPVEALVAIADRVVPIGETSEDARVVSGGAHLDGTLLSWRALAGLRVGLACAMARPQRVLRFLGRRGVTPVRIVRVRDHDAIPARALRGLGASVDVWVATPKCALHAGIPGLATLEYDLVCGPGLRSVLDVATMPYDARSSRAP